MLASCTCEVTVILTQKGLFGVFGKDFSDRQCPSNNHIPDRHLAISIEYETLKLFH